MRKALIIDPSIATENRGDEIISECFYQEMQPILARTFPISMPSQVSAFHWYQIWRNSLTVQSYSNCQLKFVAGSNLLVKDMMTHYPQWNINLWNCAPYKGCVLVGVGASAHNYTNAYTRRLYRKILNRDYIHSVRDERTRQYVESLGLKAANTGCVTMWKFTPEVCAQIPRRKARRVVFTLTSGLRHPSDALMLDTLLNLYDTVYFWSQMPLDEVYLQHLPGHEKVVHIPPTLAAYRQLLEENDLDYVGTRLHGGIYALRHGHRSLIVIVDERAQGIHNSNNLPCIARDNMANLGNMLRGEIVTDIHTPLQLIADWKAQFLVK